LPPSPLPPKPNDAKPSRARRVWAFVWRWSKRLAIASVVLAAIGVIAVIIAIRHYEADLPATADVKTNYHPPQVTRVLARDGTLLAEMFTERRTVIGIRTIPAHVKLAFLAAEDAGFYEHEGVNYLGILRAIIVNIRAGRTKQGGSTITQQVVKNLILTPEKTYKRKIQEALLARRLEQELTKDEILELYVNHIYMGHGRYGIEEAARDNFGKSAKDLTIAEAAMLAGLVASPDRYGPRANMKLALTRRAYVLGQMHQKGFLNDAQFDAAKDEPVRLAPAQEAKNELAPEVVEIARKMLEELDHDGAKRGGYTITTTIDPRLQEAARKSVRDALSAYDKRHALEGPLKLPNAPKEADKKKKGKTPPKDPMPLFDGTPDFEKHKTYVGEVVAADDATGTFDVRVGTITGSVKLADYERYNPSKLAPSAFAPPGARVRVSLLADVPEMHDGATSLPDGTSPASPERGRNQTVPLRLESGPEGALVAIDVRSRQVLALVGNYEAATGGLDRATQARRQPGSTFKPIVYSYAIHSRRWTPATLVDVNPETFDGNYRPTNYEGWPYKDPLRLREALANSVNVAAVRVLKDVGPANVVTWAESLGIRTTMKPDLSLALGSYEVHPIDLCDAYASFAAGGVYDEPRIITRIVRPDGKDVPLKAPAPQRRVLDEAEAYVITSMMTSVIDHGTATRARTLGRPLAGKTGTSNQSKDTWFSGFSTDVAATVWIGYDDGKPLGGAEAGAMTALPAWIAFMKVAHEGKPKSDFPRPAGVDVATIDKRTGKLPYADDPETTEEIFLAGTQPTEIAEPPPPPVEDAGASVDAGAGAGDGASASLGAEAKP
jgi:penicillin-binding protein 1A